MVRRYPARWAGERDNKMTTPNTIRTGVTVRVVDGDAVLLVSSFDMAKKHCLDLANALRLSRPEWMDLTLVWMQCEHARGWWGQWVPEIYDRDLDGPWPYACAGWR
jgi:hypothetical protein